MNYRTRKCSKENYDAIVYAAEKGFIYTDENGKQHRFRRNPELALIIQIMRISAVRVSDATRLKFDNIRKVGGTYILDIQIKKTGVHERNEIDGGLVDLIRAYKEKHNIRGDELLFKGNTGKAITPHAIRKQLNIIKHYLGIADDKYLSTHSFRKAAVTQAAEYGDIYMAQKLAGHRSSTWTHDYIDKSDEEMHELSAELGKNVIDIEF